KGVIHRDLKPQNVMVGRFGEVQVMDWGLAKQIDSSEPEETPLPIPATADTTNHGSKTKTTDVGLTQLGDVIGTPNSMAPEQARGDLAQINERTDVFGLGAILFQILCRRPLFDGRSSSQVLTKSASGDLAESLEHLDGVVDQVEMVLLCRRCLASDPDQRPDNADQVAMAVSQYLSNLQDQLRQAEIDRNRAEVENSEREKRQRIKLVMTAAVALVALCGTAAFAWQWRLAQTSATTTTEVNTYLRSILKAPRPERQGHDVLLSQAIDRSLPELEGRFQQHPEVEASIRREIGETYRWLGRSESAEEQLRASMAALNRSNAADPHELLLTMDRLAGVLRSRGGEEAVNEALSLRKTVLSRREQMHGKTHAETLLALNNLGAVYLESGEPERSIELYEQMLERGETLDEEAFDRVTVWLNLGEAQRQQGNVAAAESRWRKVIQACDENLLDPRRLNAHTLLGEMLADQRRFDQSEEQLRQSAEGRQALYGPLHPFTLSSLRKLSRMLIRAADYESALTVLPDLLKRHNRAIGEASGTTFGLRASLAEALAQSGQLGKADRLMKETISILSQGRGSDHRYTREAIRLHSQFLEDYPAMAAGSLDE
ncbi:MAG: tetratricopeptide repeat protein, partial [Planctomycetota bacterium]